MDCFPQKSKTKWEAPQDSNLSWNFIFVGDIFFISDDNDPLAHSLHISEKIIH